MGEAKHILCPKCGGPVSLEGFEIVEHGETWSTADPEHTSVVCPFDCGADFVITHGMVEMLRG